MFPPHTPIKIRDSYSEPEAFHIFKAALHFTVGGKNVHDFITESKSQVALTEHKAIFCIDQKTHNVVIQRDVQMVLLHDTDFDILACRLMQFE